MSDFTLINPQPEYGGYQVIVLERIDPSRDPTYRVCGKVTCQKCDQWCWLGNRSYALIIEGKTVPLCLSCATTLGVAVLGSPVANVEDEP
jgi:hypothetical protein